MTEIIAERLARKQAEAARQAQVPPELMQQVGLVAQAVQEGACRAAFGVALVQVAPNRFEWVTFLHEGGRERMALIGMAATMLQGIQHATWQGVTAPTEGSA